MWPNKGLPALGQSRGNDIDDAQDHVPLYNSHLLASLSTECCEASAKQQRGRGVQIQHCYGCTCMHLSQRGPRVAHLCKGTERAT